MATLTTLINFNGISASQPIAGLIEDAEGDLFGTTFQGGDGRGTVFEVAKTAAGYASTATVLVSFDGPDGSLPTAGLLADANGDLFGTTESGGGDGDGTVFEIAKSAAGYASTPITLVSFTDDVNGVVDGNTPYGGLIADANGNLFGTTAGGGIGYGTVFEVAKTATGYAGVPITLSVFDVSDGAAPMAGLVADANGDLFGTTSEGGANDYGTVFEVAKTAGGYASAPITLASFTSDAEPGPSVPTAGLIVDANGDLFGTSYEGGDFDGTLFEIAKTAGGYASTPTTLVRFNGVDGDAPDAGLIADANGDLFGTTIAGGANDEGAVFELAKTANGYASTPTVLASFDGFFGSNGGAPQAGLIADAHGDLFGTTSSAGGDGHGTAFELTNTGFAVSSAPPPALTITGHHQNVSLGNTETSVTVSGYDNIVTGTGTQAVSVALTGLSNTIDLGGGNDSVATNGHADGSTIVLGNGNDGVTLGTNNNTVTLGDGMDTIALGGFNNTVVAGNGDDTVTGGTGHGRVTLGNGNNTVTLGGWVNSVALGDGVNQVDAGDGGSTVQVSGGQLTLALHGHGDMVFLHGDTGASITDLSKGLSLSIDSNAVVAGIGGFGAATGGVVHLLGLSFISVQQVVGALQSDGHGGTMLGLGGTGTIDFTGLAATALHAANFALN